MPSTDAAELADRLRAARIELVARIRSGEVELGDLVPTATSEGALVKVVILAEAVPGAGKVGSRRVLEAAGIAPGSRWGEIADDQARALAASLAADHS